MFGLSLLFGMVVIHTVVVGIDWPTISVNRATVVSSPVLQNIDSHPTTVFLHGVRAADCSTRFTNEVPTVKFSLTTTMVRNRPISRVSFSCQMNGDENNVALRSTSWYMDRLLKYKSPYLPLNDSSVSSLTEVQFVHRGFRLGHKISCSVNTIVNGTNHSSPISNGFFAGIKILTPILRIRIGETDTTKLSIRLQPTVPIGCTGSRTCFVWLITYNPFNAGNTNCTTNTIMYDICGIALPSNNSETVDIPVEVYYRGQFAQSGDYEIALKTESTAENYIWADYVLPRVKVQITNDNDGVYADSTCSNMFRVSTFDGRKFPMVTGDYTLYYNTKYNTEIRTQEIGFYDKAVTSTCAVAVVAGKDIYIVDYCSTDYQKLWAKQTSNTLSVTESPWKSSVVCFPYGTCVHVSGWRLSPSTKGLLVDVRSSPADGGGAVRGLCGIFNNNCLDDFHYRQSNHGSHSHLVLENGPCDVRLDHPPAEFLKSWLVDDKLTNYLTGQFNLTSLPTWTFRACICRPMRGVGLTTNIIQGFIPCTPESVDMCSIN